MNRLIVAGALAALMGVAPAVTLAQTEGASTYSDTVPKKKSSAHHASGHMSHGHRTHHHGAHKHSAHHRHKSTSKKTATSAAASKTKSM